MFLLSILNTINFQKILFNLKVLKFLSTIFFFELQIKIEKNMEKKNSGLSKNSDTRHSIRKTCLLHKYIAAENVRRVCVHDQR